jgi:hypothetical protein
MMRNGLGRVGRGLALAGGLMVVGACAPLGAVDVLGQMAAPGVSVVEGEVRSVDARRGTFQLRDVRNRAYTLRFDRGTRVIYRQRDYPVDALERGDVVRVRVSRDHNGRLWADRVDVRQNVRDRGGLARIERVAGRVSHVDARRGHFILDLGRREGLVIHMPSRVTHDDARRFQRLRRGVAVRAEVRPLGRGAAELVRFR